jgi:hypothetical protein
MLIEIAGLHCSAVAKSRRLVRDRRTADRTERASDLKNV